jgi:hypothetical protein
MYLKPNQLVTVREVGKDLRCVIRAIRGTVGLALLPH